MKKIAIASLLATLLTGNAFAANVDVPFMHKAIPAEGLTISYNTKGNSKGSEKVLCIMEDLSKAFLYLTQNGTEVDQGLGFADNNQFYFTSVGETDADNNSSIYQFHVDQQGTIKVRDRAHAEQPYASCFYVSEPATK